MTGGQLHWLWWAGGAAVTLFGVALLLWALFADRSRGRRRCPKCWYDLSVTVGMRCSECGYEAQREKKLFKTRRRWKWAGVAAIVILIAPAFLTWSSLRSGWINVAPTTVLLLLLPLVDDAELRPLLHELRTRSDMQTAHIVVSANESSAYKARDASFHLDSDMQMVVVGPSCDKSRLWDWQWRLLHRGLTKRLYDDPLEVPSMMVALPLDQPVMPVLMAATSGKGGVTKRLPLETSMMTRARRGGFTRDEFVDTFCALPDPNEVPPETWFHEEVLSLMIYTEPESARILVPYILNHIKAGASEYPNWNLRRMGNHFDLLRLLRADDSATCNLLEELARHESDQIRRRAIMTLARLKPTLAVEHLAHLPGFDEANTIAYVVRHMFERASELGDDEVSLLFVRLIEHSNEIVRAEGLRRFAQTQIGPELKAKVEFMQAHDESGLVRLEAQMALAALDELEGGGDEDDRP